MDELCLQALKLVAESGSASMSLLQRKLSVGYNKAGKIMEWLEENKYVSPFEGAKPRRALITKAEFEEKFGEALKEEPKKTGKAEAPQSCEPTETSPIEQDELWLEALKICVTSNSASISLLQRKLDVGYNRAGKIMEWLEENKYVSPFEGAKSRRVLITKAEFEEKFGKL